MFHWKKTKEKKMIWYDIIYICNEITTNLLEGLDFPLIKFHTPVFQPVGELDVVNRWHKIKLEQLNFFQLINNSRGVT